MTAAPFKPRKFATPPELARFWRHIWVDGEYEIACNLEAPRILDIGACVGAFAVWAQVRWPGCSIECYEPNPRAYGLLTRNVEGAQLHNVAVVGNDHPHDTVTLYQGKHNLGEASLHLATGALEETGQDVPVIHARALPPAELLKLDCEGEEHHILDGYGHADGVQVVLLEYHSARIAKRCQEIVGGWGLRLVAAHEYDPQRGVQKWRRET